MRHVIRIVIIVTVVAAAAGGIAAWHFHQDKDAATSLRAVPLKRDDLVATIGATGTVEPEEVVDVGAQVAGQISAFGKDKNGKSIDYGSAVEEGTVLAQIDDSLYAADAGQAKAQLHAATAQIGMAVASLFPQFSLTGSVNYRNTRLNDLFSDLNRSWSYGSTVRWDFLNVLTAERSLYASEDALVQSDRSIAADLIALYKALGGGWELEPLPPPATASVPARR